MPRRRVAHRRRPQSRRRPHRHRRSTRGQFRRASANARTGESETAASLDPSVAPIGRGSYAAPPYSTPRRRSQRCSTTKDMGAGPWRVVADVPPVRLARQRGFHTFWRSAHGGVASRVVLGTPLETTPAVLAAHPQARICRSPRRRCWLGQSQVPTRRAPGGYGPARSVDRIWNRRN